MFNILYFFLLYEVIFFICAFINLCLRVVLIHCLFYYMNLRLFFWFGFINLCLRVRFYILSVLLQAATKTLARD